MFHGGGLKLGVPAVPLIKRWFPIVLAVVGVEGGARVEAVRQQPSHRKPFCHRRLLSFRDPKIQRFTVGESSALRPLH